MNRSLRMLIFASLFVATPILAHAWQGDHGEAASTASDSATRAVAHAQSHEPAHDYLAEVRANFTEENRRYSGLQTLINVGGPLYGVLVGLILLFSGLSARFRDIAHRVRGGYPRALIYLALYSAAGFVLGFPFAWWSGFAVEHQFGLSNQGFGAWLGDELKGLLVGIFFFGVVPLFYLAYRAIASSPRWWLRLALGSIPIIMISILIQPLVIDPLFNKFVPLKDQVLKEKVIALAEQTGIPGRNVYEVDKSAQTKKMNAYVSGFGVSQRIVFWDTILAGMAHDEILFVTGHEMGHYVLGHIWKWMGFLSIMSLGLFFATATIMRWAVARFGTRWGFTDLHDLASLPVLLISLSLSFMVAQPIFNGWSRYLEHEADIFALEVTHLNDAGARAFLKLGRDNKSNPEPSALQKAYLWTHPPLVERIGFMLDYRPWEVGKPNRLYKR